MNMMALLKEHRLMVLYFALFSINALCASIVTALLNVEWEVLSPSSKFCIIVVIIQNWTGTILALFTSGKKNGELPVNGNGSTEPAPEPNKT